MSTRDPDDADPGDPRRAADEAWRDWYARGKRGAEPGGRQFEAATAGGPTIDVPPADAPRAETPPRDPGRVGDGSFEGFLNRYLRPGTRDWAAACHVAPLLSYVIPIPACGILLAYLVWYFKRDHEAGVASHGREALNFQITLLPVTWIAYALFVLPGIVVSAMAIGLMIVASIRASQGEAFRYPFTRTATPRTPHSRREGAPPSSGPRVRAGRTAGSRERARRRGSRESPARARYPARA